MVTEFLTGVIVGLLIGLALAPVLRSWIAWQMTKAWREREAPADRPPDRSDDREHYYRTG